MKKCILLILSLSLCFLNVFSQKENPTIHLSPLTKSYLLAFEKSIDKKTPPKDFLYKQHHGVIYVSNLIKVKNENVENAIRNIGGIIGTKAGTIWTVQIPYDKMLAFTQIKDIIEIQMDEPACPQLDMARKTTRVDSVHKGINLPMIYNGEGVIMGIIDFGFDYNHPTMYDTLHDKYRISRVWELNGQGTPPPGYIYGNEMVDSNLIRQQGTDNPVQTHGTAVAGMAAGSGFGGANGNNAKLRGMAYQSEMVFVGVRRDTIAQQWLQGSFSDFIDAVNYIFSYATSVGKPCVVNISWGSQSGPHDGTTLFNQACNNLSGPGKIIVMSAGNDGQQNIHLSKTFTPSDTSIQTFLKFSSNVYQRTWVDIWGEPGKSFCGTVTLYSNNTPGNTISYCLDNATHDNILMNVNGTDTCFVQFINTTAAANGKPRMTIDIYNKGMDSVGVAITGNDGSIHAWNEYYYFGYIHQYQCNFDSLNQAWAVNGNTISTVSDMGAADSVLLIGAYASKVGFTDINNNSWTYSGYVPQNKLVPFSSRGPMADGRIKPDITAPGLTICTAISSYDTAYTEVGSNSQLTNCFYQDPNLNKKFYFAEFSGTSASAPAASGIVALMLQAKPTLSVQEAKEIIISTAIKDAHTGTIPPEGNNNWGHGKINAYGALKLLSLVQNTYDYFGKKLDCVLYPNPNKGEYYLQLESKGNESLQIEAFDILGQLLFRDDWKVQTGINTKHISIKQNHIGNYFIKVKSNEGQVVIKVSNQ